MVSVYGTGSGQNGRGISFPHDPGDTLFYKRAVCCGQFLETSKSNCNVIICYAICNCVKLITVVSPRGNLFVC